MSDPRTEDEVRDDARIILEFHKKEKEEAENEKFEIVS